jgi:spermidine synthase
MRNLWGRAPDRPSAVRVRDQDGIRRMFLGSDTVQSAMRLSDPVYLELAYTRTMMATLLFRPDPQRALLIGLGGGSLAKFIHHRLPACLLEVVESEDEVLDMARTHFALPPDGPSLVTLIGDGAAHLESRAGPPVDLLMVDVYDGVRQVARCASAAFFQSAVRALTLDGVCAVNFWSNAPEFPMYRDRFLEAFSGRVVLVPVSRPGNLIALGFASADGDWRWSRLREKARELQVQYGLEFDVFVEAMREVNPYTESRLLI